MKRLALAAALVLAAAARADAPAAVFKANCTMCHGEDGKGTSAGKGLGAPDLTTVKVSAADAAKVIAGGKGNMPGFKGKLPDADIQALGQYVSRGVK